jgi:hypothetical protein
VCASGCVIRVIHHFHLYIGMLLLEWGANDVRDFYRSASDVPTATLESKRQAFDKICENFSPGECPSINSLPTLLCYLDNLTLLLWSFTLLVCKAFRFFFLEYFKSSMEAWHTARTLYTRSCAVNSIVGHILGIGDRHTSNILVHTKTGEVVHIDFGIVFEQGKVCWDCILYCIDSLLRL